MFDQATDGVDDLLARALSAEDMLMALAIRTRGAEIDVVEALRADDLSTPQNVVLFLAMRELMLEGLNVDIATLSSRLNRDGRLAEAGGMPRLIELTRAAVTPDELPGLVGIVKEGTLQRRLDIAAKAGIELASAPGAVIDRLRAYQAAAIQIDVTNHGSGGVSLKSCVHDVLQHARAMSEGLIEPGMAYELDELDQLTRAAAGDLIIVAGRPGMGKTVLADKCQRAFSKHGCVLNYNYEMKREGLVLRLLAAESGVQTSQRHGHPYTQEENQRLDAAERLCERLDIEYMGGGYSLSGIAASATMMAKKRRVSAIVIDYLQLMPSDVIRNGQSEADRLNDITAGLKQLGLRLDIPIVLLSQLNRSVEQRDNKRPRLADLRSSGGIEQDADVVLFLYRDEYYHPDSTPDPGVVEIIIAKQRNGPLGTARQAFSATTTNIGNLTPPSGASWGHHPPRRLSDERISIPDSI